MAFKSCTEAWVRPIAVGKGKVPGRRWPNTWSLASNSATFWWNNSPCWLTQERPSASLVGTGNNGHRIANLTRYEVSIVDAYIA
jgi:hypothetical protein